MAKKNETAVAKVDTNTALVASQIDDMFGISKYQLPIDAAIPQIKILREKPMFDLPDGKAVDSIECHILRWGNANQYYDTPFGEGESLPPTCSSSDGYKPDGGTCPLPGPCGSKQHPKSACPMNLYSSAGDGKKGSACRNTIRLYLLLDGEMMPCLLVAPPTSIGSKKPLLTWLVNIVKDGEKLGIGAHYQAVRVKFSLHTEKFDAGSASIIDIETIKVLKRETDEKELKRIAYFTNEFNAQYADRITVDVGTEKSEATAADDGLPAEDEVPI